MQQLLLELLDQNVFCLQKNVQIINGNSFECNCNQMILMSAGIILVLKMDERIVSFVQFVWENLEIDESIVKTADICLVPL